LHELGHYAMAKRAGMKVTEFFIGFGPRLWSVQRGETEYGIKAIPLGGYCKIVGMTNLEDVDPADEDRTYRAKGWWARVSTVLAGPVTHFVLAIVLMYAVLVGDGDVSRAEASLRVDEVVETLPGIAADGAPDDADEVETAAHAAGLRPGDEIVERNGVAVTSWSDLADWFREHPGDEVELTVLRGGAEVPIAFTVMEVYEDAATGRISHEDFDGATARGFAGLAPTVEVPAVGWVEGLWRAPVRTWDGAVATVGALGHMFSPAGISEYLDNFSEEESNDSRFISPVGFGRIAGEAVRAGWASVLLLLFGINLFVGILNLAPLLPFDGGHIAVATYEEIAGRIRGRRVRVDFARLIPVMVAALSVLAFIFVSSLFLDIANPLDTNL
jgi:membrane-associated protease RseP (regulator of RpoE activity)